MSSFKSLYFLTSLLIDKFIDDHLASSNTHHQLATQNFYVHFARSEPVEAFGYPLEANRMFILVDKIHEHDVDWVSLDCDLELFLSLH